ncbi:MAG: RDD family protein [SAR202 cluster bacterium]|jgi:uncharacterized RDD family membrane protein YckC|nr:RDD family protein [SAR202 cluster bacterium]
MYCPHCGSENTSQARFCGNCGSSLSQESSAESTAPDGQRPTEYRFAGFWIRFFAWVIDFIVTFIGTIFIAAATPGVFSSLPLDFLFFGPLVGFILPWAYYVLLTGFTGQTLGKMAVGVRVIGPDGRPPGIAIAALREILGKINSSLVLFLGFFWVAWDRKKTGWHDHIARTHVIRI